MSLRRVVFGAAISLLWLAPARSQPGPAAPSAFDGKWFVTLICENVKDKDRVTKGYTFRFPAEIRDGKLSAQHGVENKASSLKLAGTVAPDGSSEITATGYTGNPDYTVGSVNTGTPYSYRMSGSFTATSGTAKRIDLRPCEATFTKQ